MKRHLTLLLFFLASFLIKTTAQSWNWTDLKYYPYHETNLKYCNLALKVELQEVFLNGGMCGHKVFRVKEVIKGEYPYPYVRVFMCNTITSRDYVKEMVILSDGITKETYTSKRDCWNSKDSVTSAEITGIFCLPDTCAAMLPDLKEFSPPEFLRFLQNQYLTCAIINDKMFNWVKDEHLKELVALLDSKELAIPVYESYNTDCQQYTSTVGIEALFLLEGYREGVYPPDRCSLGPYTHKDSEHENTVEERKKEIIHWLKSKGKYFTK